MSEDLSIFFFFWSSPNFGQKNKLILSGEIFLLVFMILKFPGPPPFSKIQRTPLAPGVMKSRSVELLSPLDVIEAIHETCKDKRMQKQSKQT